MLVILTAAAASIATSLAGFGYRCYVPFAEALKWTIKPAQRPKADLAARTHRAIHALLAETLLREEGNFPPRLRRSPRIRVLYNRATEHRQRVRCGSSSVGLP